MFKKLNNGDRGAAIRKVINDNFLKVQSLFETKHSYHLSITKASWDEDRNIVIPYSTHQINAPSVEVFMIVDGEYVPVLGCHKILESGDVILSTGFLFEGKVVVQ